MNQLDRGGQFPQSVLDFNGVFVAENCHVYSCARLSLNLLTLVVLYRRAIPPLPVSFDACVSEKFRGVNQRSLRAFRISLEMESGPAL
jgi:hypothetical protein